MQSTAVQDWHFSVCTRRSAILRLEAVGSSSPERNLCVNFGQAQIERVRNRIYTKASKRDAYFTYIRDF